MTDSEKSFLDFINQVLSSGKFVTLSDFHSISNVKYSDLKVADELILEIIQSLKSKGLIEANLFLKNFEITAVTDNGLSYLD